MDALKLSSHTVVEDKEAVRRKVYMIMPTTYTVYYDMCMIMHTNQFLMTNNLTLLHSTSSGEIFDCFAKWVPGYSTGRGRRAHTKNLVPSLGLTRTVTRFRQRPCAITCCMRADTLKTQVIFASSSKTETKNTTVCMYAADKSKFTGVMFPDSSFIAELEKLGFSDNTGVTNVEVTVSSTNKQHSLMPIVMYSSDE